MISSVGYQANPTCPVANPDTVSLLRIIIIRGYLRPVAIRGYLRPVAIRGYLRPVAIRGYRCPVTLTTERKHKHTRLQLSSQPFGLNSQIIQLHTCIYIQSWITIHLSHPAHGSIQNQPIYQ
ncbi:uncharacterized protein DS421_9g266960 [Arachis hypogaea]|nr:uncharacterized protein DS421_9g266960 [Arachis hypogaea]